ncbi:MAG: endolytic transglycosylase MltG [Halobacteriovoraceae bacterium]|jgi:UPF0755 protein|nr:endolytic transglycosylase MltG [Halobacteriovoraceae bacterium]MBT5095099.1 endolytic transglycosylase MltG [Halobacteriovoraceae bacterium]
MKKKFWIFLILSSILAVGFASYRVYHVIAIWRYQGPAIQFVVKPGEGFSKINGRLARQGLIQSSKIFYRYCKSKSYMTKFKAGKYQIESGTSMLDIIDLLIKGHSITASVTIPEGKNLYEIAKILEAKKIIKSRIDFINLAKNPEFTASLKIPAKRIEGYLYPDTYRFTPNSNPKQIIKLMVRNFFLKITKVDISATSLDLHSVVTLASVVEKETGAKFERPIISGVFHNRLKKRMRLQSDPTTIYGIWETYNGNLRKRHLQEKTPYNTYRINGLPRGPIANPGLQSLEAVIFPQKHQFLYFVSQNDGTHKFSKTYKEHLEAVTKWQKNRANRKGKSWRNLKQ